MVKVIEINQNVKGTADQLKKVSDVLWQALDKAKTLESQLEHLNWSGQTYEHIRVLLEMIIRYHNDLVVSSQELENVVRLLSNKYQYVEQNENFLKLRGVQYDI